MWCPASGPRILVSVRRFPIIKRHGLCLLTATFLTAFALPQTGISATYSGEEESPFLMPALPEGNQNEQPVDLEADNLIHDEAKQTVTAVGNVELVQAGRIIKADSIAYNLQTDQVRAQGNVVLSEADGTTYFAEDVELTQDMKNGFVEGLQILLADGSRFTAEEGKRTGGTIIELKRATYTPCEPCKENPAAPPLWQLRADEVVHDQADKRITYHDAWFDFAGVPVAYTPYFSHPDGTEEQKSGFLFPTFGFDSELGASVADQYYWAIAPDEDATFGTALFSTANPVALGEYRKRFENAEIQFNASGTYSDRKDSSAGLTTTVEDEARGHLFGEGIWDINKNWRSGFNLAVASDDQYLRQYDIESDDVLENEIYAERFSGRNYLVGRALAFQDIRVSERQVEQPGVLPEVVASFYGAPNDVLGGRWTAALSALGLYRDGNGQDVGRSSAELGWERRYITGFGLVNKFDALLRGDAYRVEDRPGLLDDDSAATQTRGFAQANLETSYPFVKRFEKSQMVVSPVVALTTGTNIDFDDDIPNEDSQGFTLDPTNLFEPNRFPGYDLIEDRSRVTYGIRTGWFGDNGYRGEVFLGQSRRFDDDDNPFRAGSGLSDQASDYVGQVTAALGGYFDLDYRFQLENSNFTSQRHELDSNLNIWRLDLGLHYLYADALEGTTISEAREQFQPNARFRFWDDWYLTGAMSYDLGENEGLRYVSTGIDYIGQCMNFSLIGERTLTEERTGDSETEILLRIGFKNLGEFRSSGISLGGGSDSAEEDEEQEDIRNAVTNR